MPRPERPSDADYYERDRVELVSQGDLFRDVPLAYPLPADELLVDEASGGRRFLTGPLAFGPAMLITPSCSVGAQGAAGYGHPVRTLVPVIPLAQLIDQGVVKETALADLRRFDHLINYMYLPPLDINELDFSMPESAALLYMPARKSLASRHSLLRWSGGFARIQIFGSSRRSDRRSVPSWSRGWSTSRSPQARSTMTRAVQQRRA
jgi:hypothetical protein